MSARLVRAAATRGRVHLIRELYPHVRDGRQATTTACGRPCLGHVDLAGDPETVDCGGCRSSALFRYPDLQEQA